MSGKHVGMIPLHSHERIMWCWDAVAKIKLGVSILHIRQLQITNLMFRCWKLSIYEPFAYHGIFVAVNCVESLS